MKKFRIFLRLDKEEKWLEQMASKGWLLASKSWCYDFQKVDSQNQTIRIDYRIFTSANDFSDYCMLFEDSGWHHIAGNRNSGSQYFRKISACGSAVGTEDIFSDTLSRAGRYKRISNMWLSAVIPLVPLLTMLINEESLNFLFTPREWYLTPGLWELKGPGFWWAFLFETPFAVGRGAGWCLLVIAIIFYFIFAIKSRLLYRSAVSSNE